MSTHPDLEALNAVLDGESEGAGAGDAGHVAGCAACQARLDQLRSVQGAVGGPVAPPAAAVRETAIAQALASFSSGSGSAGAEEPASTPAPPTELRRRGGGRVWESPVWRWAAGSAAAAVLAIAVVTAALGGGTRSDDEGVALSAGPGGDKATQESAGAASDGVVNGGDLGEVRDTATLRSMVPSVQRGQSVVAPAVGSPSAAAADAAAPAAPVPRTVGTRVCEIEARTARPQLALLVYAANLRYQGTPAVVLGFGDFPGSVPVTLLVLAPGESCRVLAESTAP